ncbi:unnamed protein product [Lymnaea stagnalis]|uniref:BRISC and BRCA1-A complex member 1 n=1 Tax=Lymnaea stagnalis TaxID=6523 RepID=A0AAV2I759_LYMST
MEQNPPKDHKIVDKDTNNCNYDSFRVSTNLEVDPDLRHNDDRTGNDFGAQSQNSSSDEIVDSSHNNNNKDNDVNVNDDCHILRLRDSVKDCHSPHSLALCNNSIPSTTAVMDDTRSNTKHCRSTTPTNHTSSEHDIDGKSINNGKSTIMTHEILSVLSKNEGESSEKEQAMISSQNIICPRVNCPEKIIICLDLNEEMDSTIFRSRAGDKYSGLELAKRTIKMFVMHKTQMNPKHEFALLIFYDESTMIHNFTSRAQDILNTVDESVIETHKSGPLSLSHLFETIKENIELPTVQGDPEVVPPPYIIRVILVFGRSRSVPTLTSTQAKSILESSPYFFTDVLYIHEPPTEDNKCEEIFHSLCELDHSGLSYIFEHSKYTQILNSGAKLLPHPLQRPGQMDAMYKISSLLPPVSTKEDNI